MEATSISTARGTMPNATTVDAQVQFQQQLNLKAQEANIALAQQQQTYAYREAMAKEIAKVFWAVL